MQVFILEVQKLFMKLFFHHDKREIQPVTQSGNEGSKRETTLFKNNLDPFQLLDIFFHHDKRKSHPLRVEMKEPKQESTSLRNDFDGFQIIFFICI